jgi:hypothetical protein
MFRLFKNIGDRRMKIESITKALEKNKTKLLDEQSESAMNIRIKKSKELTKILEDSGFEFVGSGLSREVYADRFRDIVVKLEVNDGDENFNQNKQEVENWLQLSSKVKKFFLPILAYAKDYSWLVMPFAPSIEEEEESINFEEELRKNDIYYEDFGRSNIGVYKGEAVIRDYGYGNSKDWIRKEVSDQIRELKGNR